MTHCLEVAVCYGVVNRSLAELPVRLAPMLDFAGIGGGTGPHDRVGDDAF